MKFWNFNFWSILIIALFYIVLFFVHVFRIGVSYDGWLNYCVHILQPLMFYAYVLDSLIHFHKGAVFVLRLKIGGYFSRPNIRTNNRFKINQDLQRSIRLSHIWNHRFLLEDAVQITTHSMH